MIAVPAAPSGLDLVVVNLVLEPLELLQSDVAEVGGYDFDPTCNGLKVVESWERAVLVIIEAVWSSDGNLGRVGKGLVGGMFPGRGLGREWSSGDLEDRVLDVPGVNRVGAGELNGIVGSGSLPLFSPVLAEARASAAPSPSGGAWGGWFILAGHPGLGVGEPQLGVELPGVGAGWGGHFVVDVPPDPVEGQLHVGVDVPGVVGLGLRFVMSMDFRSLMSSRGYSITK